MPILKNVDVNELLALLKKNAPGSQYSVERGKKVGAAFWLVKINEKRFSIGPRSGNDPRGFKLNINSVFGDNWPPDLADFLERKVKIKPNKPRAEESLIVEADETVTGTQLTEQEHANGFRGFEEKINKLKEDLSVSTDHGDQTVNVLPLFEKAAIELLKAYRNIGETFTGAAVQFFKNAHGLNREKSAQPLAIAARHIRNKEISLEAILADMEQHLIDTAAIDQQYPITRKGIIAALSAYEREHFIDQFIMNKWLDPQLGRSVEPYVQLSEEQQKAVRARIIQNTAMLLLQHE